jgi:hypothetical protein
VASQRRVNSDEQRGLSVTTSAATNHEIELKPPTAQLATHGGIWRLAVSFHWRVDRFEHRVVAVRHDEALNETRDETADSDSSNIVLPLVRMVADRLVCDWPANPPLQQLDECVLSGQRRGLVGLGMAGTSHWSLAVEADERGLWFDVACRIQRPPAGLQTSYELAEPFGAACIESVEADRCRVVGPSARDSLCELRADAASTAIVVDGDGRHLQLQPRLIPDRLPATVRWRYGWVATA